MLILIIFICIYNMIYNFFQKSNDEVQKHTASYTQNDKR